MQTGETVIMTVLMQVRCYCIQSRTFSFLYRVTVVLLQRAVKCCAQHVLLQKRCSVFPLFSGCCRGGDDVAKLKRSKYPSPAWGSTTDFHWDDMSRDICLKPMSHLRHTLPPDPGAQMAPSVAESHSHSLLSSQGQEQCWSTLCHIPLSHFTYDVMQLDRTCLEG